MFETSSVTNTQRQHKKLFFVLGGIAILIVAGLIWFFVAKNNRAEQLPNIEQISEEDKNYSRQIIGKSVEGREIEVYTFGSASKHLLFIGGIHGGYEWNSVLLAYQFIDYFMNNPIAVPSDMAISIIPSANPDGVFAYLKKEGRFNLIDIPTEKNTTGIGRFNANNVDLNRNFDCKWKPQSSWRSRIVSAGTAPFSEPEALAIKNFVEKNNPSAVIAWHSQANTVYASECENGVLPETLTIMNLYAKSAGYFTAPTFDAYEITGDLEGWLAKIGIPAITVELKTHETIEWEQNFAGVMSLIDYYSKKQN